MKNILIGLVSVLLCSYSCNRDPFSQDFVSADLNNFWDAYDKIISTEDTSLQKRYLNEIYLDKGTEGLKNLIAARRYSDEEYLNGINAYPKFWKSLRPNTKDIDKYQKEISRDIKQLKKVYPDLKPAPIYFCFGAFRTGGTAYEDNVLIGCELSLADEKVDISELPNRLQTFYEDYRPLENLALLCTHEYIHTQQNEMVRNLLCESLYEGVAEFISCKATGKPSNTPAIHFGKENEAAVVAKFVEDLYLMDRKYNWLWGENSNEFKIRDLGYYIGYEICERYYEQSRDKTKAIKELIELDYTNDAEVERIVDASKLLPKPIIALFNEYQEKRPTVVKIEEFENGSKNLSPDNKKITVLFSEALNGHQSDLDFGPLGKDFFPKVRNETRKWGPNNQSYSFNVDLESGKKYQMMIGSNFRLESGIRLKPYVIEFETKK